MRPPGLPAPEPDLPLRCCLLSGGSSRRMGRDKALLPHPDGGTWLERTLRMLARLQAPITLLSRHKAHLELAEALQDELEAQGGMLEPIAEPAPWEGPLLALHRLMERYPDQRLLLCPVDMPDLSLAALLHLLSSACCQPGRLQLAHDGERLQPLLGLYPSSPAIRGHLAAAVARGERRLQSWLMEQPHQEVPLDPQAIRNVNRTEGLPNDNPGEISMASAIDLLQRPLGVLRLSLTARCNLACPYCLPDGTDPPGLLTLAQRLAVIEAAVALGATRLRLTGGEPLLHDGLEELIAAVQPLRALQPGDRGLDEISLTSNGTLLSAPRARALRAAGLDRITLSLDGTTGASVARMAGLGGSGRDGQVRHGEAVLAQVLAAIEHARSAGFDPAGGALKLNAVIRRGANDDQLLPLAGLAREQGLELRLIEFMDVGNRNGWNPDEVLSAAEMVATIDRRWPLEPLGRASQATASRWRFRDGAGTLAVVASISEPFCGDCNRLRVTADGIAYTCLFAHPASGVDLRPWLKNDTPAEALHAAITGLWRQRADRYSEERAEQRFKAASPGPRHSEMAYLGG